MLRQVFASSGQMLKECARVVVAEDDEAIRVVLSSTLEQEGYSVEGASDGAEALSLICSERPRLLLLDLMLPRLDGYEVLRRLRAKPSTRYLPVIVLSAWDFPRHRDKAFAAGCTAFIGKPFDLDEVLAEVRSHVVPQC